jgi:tetratricopeptide (TPR) repeat protein
MRPLAVAAACGVLVLVADIPLRGGAAGFPPLGELPSTPFSTQDAALASAGLRAAAADIAWIQLLDYGGGGLPAVQDPPGRPYYFIKDLTLRVVRLDPRFHRAYLYGAGILGWSRGMERPTEAAELLQEGLRRDPGEKLFTLYLAALAFQKKGDTDRMIGVLESTLDDPGAPLTMRPILANIYKSKGEYRKALALWELILDDERMRDDHPRAVSQIADLKALLKGKGPQS